MTFLVSTSQQILLIDTEQETVYHVHSGKGLYYGLALRRGRVIAACRNRQPSSDDSQRPEERGSLLFFDERLRVEKEVQPPFPLRDIHGIASIDDRIWVTCAFDNLVAIFDPDTQSWTKWYPASDPSARDQDVHHFNTIAEIDERLVLLAHNWGDSHIRFYDYSSLELESVRPLGVQAHNLFLVDGSLATCSSGEGLLVSESGWRIRTGSFPRGFAADSQVKAVGLSRNAKRDQRSVVDGVIRIFDDTWRFEADYVLSGVGMILDILPISFDNRALPILDRWTHMEINDGDYGLGDAGDCYIPGDQRLDPNAWLEWHVGEGAHRWTAARDAGMEVIINPGEQFLTARALSELPGHYLADVCLNGRFLGRLEFPAAGVTSATFSLEGCPPGRAHLSFRVPNLWKPADYILGSRDARSLGIAVCLVKLHGEAIISNKRRFYAWTKSSERSSTTLPSDPYSLIKSGGDDVPKGFERL